jgi:hypothetical protein
MVTFISYITPWYEWKLLWDPLYLQVGSVSYRTFLYDQRYPSGYQINITSQLQIRPAITVPSLALAGIYGSLGVMDMIHIYLISGGYPPFSSTLTQVNGTELPTEFDIIIDPLTNATSVNITFPPPLISSDIGITQWNLSMTDSRGFKGTRIFNYQVFPAFSCSWTIPFIEMTAQNPKSFSVACTGGFTSIGTITVSEWTSSNTTVITEAQWRLFFASFTSEVNAPSIQLTTCASCLTAGNTTLGVKVTDSQGTTNILSILMILHPPMIMNLTGLSRPYSWIGRTSGPHYMSCSGGKPPYTLTLTSSYSDVTSQQLMLALEGSSPAWSIIYPVPSTLVPMLGNIAFQFIDSIGGGISTSYQYQVTYIAPHSLSHRYIYLPLFISIHITRLFF